MLTRGGVAQVALLVEEYDAAIASFRDRLGFRLVEDTPTDGKRWVVMDAGSGARLLLARATDASQRALVGGQAAGRVFLFLETDDIARDHATMSLRGVAF
jgi:catechol 2,3-dioxygenase-like lactoylglutathione lyase family enzyme